MSDNDILVEILHAVGELKQGFGGLQADMATVKGDVAQMKAQPAKKRAERLAMLGGFLGFASLLLTAIKLFAN